MWEYIAKFPEEVFDDPCFGDYLSDVSISSVSSCDDSDNEEVTNIHLSEVEIDSEVEESIIMSGGRVIDLATLANDAAIKSEAEDKGAYIFSVWIVSRPKFCTSIPSCCSTAIRPLITST